MNCQEFWNSTPELATDHAHLAECPACAGRMRRQQELTAGLRALAGTLDRLEAPPRVEARLVKAFRAQAGVSRAPVRTWRPVLTWAAAFAAVLAIGVLVVRERTPEAARPSNSNALILAGADASPAQFDPNEDGFLPLPGAAQLAPAEDMDMVRVELPRSAMMQVGIEVSPDRAGEIVRADVMVGADGLARSVRFLEGSD
jgi:hypothetical protein